MQEEYETTDLAAAIIRQAEKVASLEAETMHFAAVMLQRAKTVKLTAYTRHSSNGKACALGLVEVKTLKAEDLFPWLYDAIAPPCDCRRSLDVNLTPMASAACTIAHLFNEHVMGPDEGGRHHCPDAKPWTLKQLAKWIKSIDPTLKKKKKEEDHGQSNAADQDQRVPSS